MPICCMGLRNARSYHQGELKAFDDVGVRAVDERTLVMSLTHPVPYFLSLLTHWTWFPVHPPTVLESGPMDQRRTSWTKPGRYVGNGPYSLAAWKMGQEVVVKKNPYYWDKDTVRLNEIHFHSIGDATTEERAFRDGLLHLTHQLPLNKVDQYRSKNPEALRIEPYLATYFYCFNVNRPPLDDVRVRRALTLAVHREDLVRYILKGGQEPATHFTPPNTAGYNPIPVLTTDVEEARDLLAMAGFPGGERFPKLELLYNTSENHRTVAQAIQQMWKTALNIDVALVNQEWKVYINSRRQGAFDICRFGWTGDYLDPRTFLDMWVTGGGNNAAGWSNLDYDRLIQATDTVAERAKRFELFQQAENLLLSELPVLPLYFYTSVYLKHPSVKGWYPNVLDHRSYKHIYLESVPATASF